MQPQESLPEQRQERLLARLLARLRCRLDCCSRRFGYGCGFGRGGVGETRLECSSVVGLEYSRQLVAGACREGSSCEEQRREGGDKGEPCSRTAAAAGLRSERHGANRSILLCGLVLPIVALTANEAEYRDGQKAERQKHP